MYLFLDTETGGLDPQQYDLLEVYACVTDANLNIVDAMHIYPKPVLGYYRIHPNALRINKFVPPERLHDIGLREFLQEYGVIERLLPVGWNVAFDISFIKERLGAEYWDKYVRYHKFDLQVLAEYFRMIGKLDVLNTKLATIAEYYGLPQQDHTAKNDVYLCIEIMKRFLSL